jgi:hypothetical protein
MTLLTKPRVAVASALTCWLALSAVRVGAQTRQDSLSAAHDCAAAARIVRHGHPDKKEEWAWATLMGCGAAGGDAAREAWLSQRAERDTAQLEGVFGRLWSFRDASLFDAAMSIAGDASAAPQSRVYSAMMLLEQLLDHDQPDYKYFSTTGEFGVCRIGSVFGRQIAVGTPLAPDARTRAHGLAQSLAADAAAPSEVRSAGRCLDQALTMDDRVQAKKPIQRPPPS